MANLIEVLYIEPVKIFSNGGLKFYVWGMGEGRGGLPAQSLVSYHTIIDY